MLKLSRKVRESPSTKSNELPANSKEEPEALTLVFTFTILLVIFALALITEALIAVVVEDP